MLSFWNERIRSPDTSLQETFRKAVAALRKQKTKIETREQARVTPQIGERSADKIEEIVSTNKLQRLEHAKSDPNEQVMQLLMGIYGVGVAVSSKRIAQGYRTLDDIRTKVDFTANQGIGLEHYEDFRPRIPRAEVAEHARIVQDTLRKFDPGF